MSSLEYLHSYSLIYFFCHLDPYCSGADPYDVPLSPNEISRVAGDMPQWTIVAEKFKLGIQDITDIIDKNSEKNRGLEFLRILIGKNGSAVTYKALHDVYMELGELGAAERIYKILDGMVIHFNA